MNAGEAGLTGEERTWGMLAHLAALCGFVVPFGNLVAPLMIGGLKASQYVKYHGREAFNFQVSVTVLVFVGSVVWIVVAGGVFGFSFDNMPTSPLGYVWLLVGAVCGAAAFVGPTVLVLIGAIRAQAGVRYRYPLTIRLLKGPQAPTEGGMGAVG